MQEKLLVDEMLEEEMLGKFTHRATVINAMQQQESKLHI
jgi:hypothetical protein